MLLEPTERVSPIWIKLKRHLEDRLDTLRLMNDAKMTEDERNLHIGRIQEVKRLLDLEHDPPIVG